MVVDTQCTRKSQIEKDLGTTVTRGGGLLWNDRLARSEDVKVV